jgi:hypothetical protein
MHLQKIVTLISCAAPDESGARTANNCAFQAIVRNGLKALGSTRPDANPFCVSHMADGFLPKSKDSAERTMMGFRLHYSVAKNLAVPQDKRGELRRLRETR